jgi:hypothetical protein
MAMRSSGPGGSFLGRRLAKPALTPSQRSAVLASYLGWTVDAFVF